MYATATLVLIGLTIANFMVEAFTERKWGTAIDKSLIQAVALGSYLLAMAID